MKETEKLIQIITRFCPQKLPLLNQSETKNNGLENKLYENIKAGKYKNEEEALLDLYNGEEDYHKYRMLKSRLKQKLYNHVLFVEKDIIIAKKEEKQCLDYAYRGKSLLLVAEYHLAKKQFDKAIKLASRYEFTEIVVDCLEKIAFISTQTPDPKLYNETSEKLGYFRAIKKCEDQASEIYYEARLALSAKISIKKEYLKGLPRKIAILKTLWEKTKSFNIFQKYNMLNGWYLELTGNFVEAINYIQRCEMQLKEGKINRLRFDSRINKFSMVYALLRTKRYKEGLSLVARDSKLFPIYSRNWFAFMAYHCLLAMHAGQYDVAGKVIKQLEQQNSKITLKKSTIEDWQLYKAYLYFLSKGVCGDDFSFPQFINAVPGYTKDKLGHNISILILQFLFLLKKKDYEQLSSKEETYRKYANTYLKDPYSKRSYYLFKLMLLIIRVDFCPGKSIKKGQVILEKLKNTPELGDAYSNIEIVPYENLWEVMINYLQINNGRSSDLL